MEVNVTIFVYVMGVLHPNNKLACFVLYLKIIDTFLKNDVCILQLIVQGIQKRH